MIPLLLFASAAAKFSGTWIFEVEGRHALILTLDPKGGSLVRPKTFDVDGEGEVTRIGGEWTKSEVKWGKKPGEFRAGSETYRITLADGDHATLAPLEVFWLGIPLRRARASEPLTLPASWPAREYPPEIAAVQARLKEMVDLDQAVREGKKISFEAMEAADSKHRPEIERIFERYGWPKRSVFGRETAHSFWLLVQHQPLELQEKMLPAMELAIQNGEASRSDYAYLFDRVSIRQGKPQRWGTQAKCVNGLPVLDTVEDQARLDARRSELRLAPIKVYLSFMKDMCRAMR